MTSIFATPKIQMRRYPYRYHVELAVQSIAGGTPSTDKVAEGWLKGKFAESDELLRQAVAETMIERGIDAEQAIELVAKLRTLQGFKRDANGLYYEGRCMKAAIKESACITWPWPEHKWGPTNKSSKSWFAEHVFVVEHRIPLGVNEADGISQSFVDGRYGRAIKHSEYVENAHIEFTVVTDHKFTDEQWEDLWTCCEMQGIGAERSQNFGKFEVRAFEPVTVTALKKRVSRARRAA